MQRGRMQNAEDVSTVATTGRLPCVLWGRKAVDLFPDRYGDVPVDTQNDWRGVPAAKKRKMKDDVARAGYHLQNGVWVRLPGSLVYAPGSPAVPCRATAVVANTDIIGTDGNTARPDVPRYTIDALEFHAVQVGGLIAEMRSTTEKLEKQVADLEEENKRLRAAMHTIQKNLII